MFQTNNNIFKLYMKNIIIKIIFVLLIIYSFSLFFKKTKVGKTQKENFAKVGAREFIKDPRKINHNDTALALGHRGNTIDIFNNKLFDDEVYYNQAYYL